MSERGRGALWPLCAQRPWKEGRKEKEINCEEGHNEELCNPYFEYNKAKFPVDVATSLIVNHVNYGVLYLYVVFVFMIMLSIGIRRICINS